MHQTALWVGLLKIEIGTKRSDSIGSETRGGREVKTVFLEDADVFETHQRMISADPIGSKIDINADTGGI